MGPEGDHPDEELELELMESQITREEVGVLLRSQEN